MTAEAALRRIPRTAIRSDAWWVFPAVPLLAGAIAFAWILHAELQRLYGLTGSAWDFAYDQQVIWNISQGQGFYSSFARANFLGIHFELIFVVLAAVEKLWPSPAVLLIFSSAGIAATAPAAYLFFRAILPADRADTPWLAVALSVPIPFWAAVQEAARDFFHPENMALAFALLAPRWLLLAVPPYLANVLSGHTPQNILHLHYVLLLLFPMIVACAVGAAKYLETHSLKPAKALAAMLPALILGFAMGRFPPALESDASLYAHPDTVAQLRAATRIIPADAPVDADDGLTVWLANRHTINDLPDRS